jgi:hypothetical protein
MRKISFLGKKLVDKTGFFLIKWLFGEMGKEVVSTVPG